MIKFIRSFSYAFSGIVSFIKAERNFAVQLCLAVVVVFIGWYFNISQNQWLIILICITMVLSLEMVNTAIEKLSDVVHPSFHPVIRTVKDIAAGSVLVAASGSLVIALIIFIPKLNFWFHHLTN